MLDIERDNGMTATVLIPQDIRYRGGKGSNEFYVYDSEIVVTIESLLEMLKQAHLTKAQKVLHR